MGRNAAEFDAAIGIAPRTQIGSQLILNAIGIYNGNAKINLLRLDRLDLALTGAILRCLETQTSTAT